MRQSLPALALAFAVGVAVGTAGVGFGTLSDADTATDAPRDFESPGFSLAKSLGSCGDGHAHGGWIHDVAVGETFALTLNATVVHEWNESVTANVTRTSPGVFRIDLRTGPGNRVAERAREKNVTRSPPDCASTTLDLATNLPTDYRRFTVSLDGRDLRTVENDGTGASLTQLPNLIDATAGNPANVTAGESANATASPN